MLRALVMNGGEFYLEENGTTKRASVMNVTDELGVNAEAFAVGHKNGELCGMMLISTDLCEFLLQCFGKVYLNWDYYHMKPIKEPVNHRISIENYRLRRAVRDTYGEGINAFKNGMPVWTYVS